VIGQTLALEGVCAFFLEAAFLYSLLYGERRLGPRGHWLAALLVFLGSWLSGYFIICTNAWMQHPLAYEQTGAGLSLTSLWALLTNPWAIVQYIHNMAGAVITGSPQRPAWRPACCGGFRACSSWRFISPTFIPLWRKHQRKGAQVSRGVRSGERQQGARRSS
jgi:hypothetical protein